MSEHLRQLSRFPSVLPIQLALPDVRLPQDGPGISGALLATTPASLRSHFLPGCYDEDWIWLALLGRPGTAIRRAGAEAVHAALPQEGITADLVTYQCAGEILYRAIREISDTWDGGCSLPEHCAASMSVAHFRRAMRSMAGEIGSAIQQVTRTREIALSRCGLRPGRGGKSSLERDALAFQQLPAMGRVRRPGGPSPTVRELSATDSHVEGADAGRSRLTWLAATVMSAAQLAKAVDSHQVRLGVFGPRIECVPSVRGDTVRPKS